MAEAVYDVDPRDQVKVLTDLPQCSVGAPLPHVLADESRVVVAYLLEESEPDWDGTSARAVTPNSDDETLVFVVFEGVRAHFLGPPNDEAFGGHPLYERGLRPYGAYEVLDSSWIRRLAAMNEIHPHHRPEHFASLRHIVLSFHDTTFECCCQVYAHRIGQGSLVDSVDLMGRLLHGEAN